MAPDVMTIPSANSEFSDSVNQITIANDAIPTRHQDHTDAALANAALAMVPDMIIRSFSQPNTDLNLESHAHDTGLDADVEDTDTDSDIKEMGVDEAGMAWGEESDAISGVTLLATGPNSGDVGDIEDTEDLDTDGNVEEVNADEADKA